jgi:hypothetical protein
VDRRHDPIEQINGGGMALRMAYVQSARELNFKDFVHALSHDAPGLGGGFLPGDLSLRRRLAICRE